MNVQGSPYKKVLNNIDTLLYNDIAVSIRLNMDRGNADDLMSLADELGQRFSRRKGFSVYVALLQHFAGEIDAFESDEDAKAAYLALQGKLEVLGINSKRGWSKHVHVNHCMADSPQSVTILPDGHLGRCEHHSENEFVGSIYTDTIDEAVMESWKTQWDKGPECDDCVVYPQCHNLKKCPGHSECTPLERWLMIQHLKEKMLNTYHSWKAEQEEKQNNDEVV